MTSTRCTRTSTSMPRFWSAWRGNNLLRGGFRTPPRALDLVAAFAGPGRADGARERRDVARPAARARLPRLAGRRLAPAQHGAVRADHHRAAARHDRDRQGAGGARP